VGVPCPGVQVRISPEGEVLIKSPGPVVGYYKQPELTPEPSPTTASSAPATWASSAPTACCKLTGRAKELFKTAKGKYVAPAPIENRSTPTRWSRCRWSPAWASRRPTPWWCWPKRWVQVFLRLIAARLPSGPRHAAVLRTCHDSALAPAPARTPGTMNHPASGRGGVTVACGPGDRVQALDTRTPSRPP
jgi:hypothetical protein